MATTNRRPARKGLTTSAVQEGGSAQDYPALLAEVKTRIQSAQVAALRAVNKALVGLYWDIGRLIVVRQQREGWGKAVVEQLSTDLRAAFPGVGRFSTQNLWYMRQMVQEYSATPNLQPLVGEIGWAHNLLILSRCKEAQAREFYLRLTRKFGWSKNVLAHQIDNQSFEKSLLGQTNSSARCSSTWPRWMRRCGSPKRTRPSASSRARRRIAPSSNTPCSMRASPLAWRHARSPTAAQEPARSTAVARSDCAPAGVPVNPDDRYARRLNRA